MEPISDISERLKGTKPGPGEARPNGHDRRTSAAAKDQLALDEVQINDPEVEAALDARQLQKERAGAARKLFKASDDLAKAAITRLELPEGGAVRVGRFRITRTAIAAKTVSFETQPSSRLRIALIDDKG